MYQSIQVFVMHNECLHQSELILSDLIDKQIQSISAFFYRLSPHKTYIKYQLMKPGQKPYDRNSKLWQTLDTVNPCNDFIVQFLVRCKIKNDKQNLNQYYCYSLAIESVKKYPLPILCNSQLSIIEGFGDFFKRQTLKLIKKHYTRGRAPTAEEKKQDEEEQNVSLINNIRKINNRKSQRKRKKLSADPAKSDEDNSQLEFQARMEDNEQDQIEYLEITQQNNGGESVFFDNPPSRATSRSVVSSATSKGSGKSYKPKTDSEQYTILHAMYDLNAYENPVSKGDINEYLYEKKQMRIQTWHIAGPKLKDSDYIQEDEQDFDLLFLTDKGARFVEKSQNVEVSARREEQPYKQRTQKLFKGLNKPVITPPAYPKEITLLVNSRDSVFTQQQLQKIEQKFVCTGSEAILERNALRYSKRDFVVGDFLWQIEGDLLDVVISRVNLNVENKQQLPRTKPEKMTEFEEQFRTLCYKMKATEATELILFVELDEKGKKLRWEDELKQIDYLLTKAKITKFKTYRVKNFSEIVTGLEAIRKLYIKQLKKAVTGHKLLSLGKLHDYNQRCQRKDPHLIINMFICSLRCFPCITLRIVQGIIQKIHSFMKLSHDLRELKQKQRYEFMDWLLADHGGREGINRMIVDFICLEKYD